LYVKLYKFSSCHARGNHPFVPPLAQPMEQHMEPKHHVHMRIDPALFAPIAVAAKCNDRSVSAEIRHRLRESIEQRDAAVEARK
jgi:hypothetical protein